jgi:hypothetical protein
MQKISNLPRSESRIFKGRQLTIGLDIDYEIAKTFNHVCFIDSTRSPEMSSARQRRDRNAVSSLSSSPRIAQLSA